MSCRPGHHALVLTVQRRWWAPWQVRHIIRCLEPGCQLRMAEPWT